MAVFISNDNCKNFKESNQDISRVLTQWDSPCDAIKQCLDGEVGSVFNDNFGIGRTAHSKIVALIDILQEMETSINTLITNTNKYLDEYNENNHTVI